MAKKGKKRKKSAPEGPFGGPTIRGGKDHVKGEGTLRGGLRLDHPRRCIAHTPRGRCRSIGMKGTDPPRCRYHGGAIRKHGMGKGRPSRFYSRFISGPFKKTVEMFENDPNLKDLRGEIALARGVLTALVEGVKGKKHAIVLAKDIDTASRTVGVLVEKLSKIEDGLKLHLDLGAAKYLVEQLVNIVNDEVKDPKVRQRIAERVEQMDVLKLGAYNG